MAKTYRSSCSIWTQNTLIYALRVTLPSPVKHLPRGLLRVTKRRPPPQSGILPWSGVRLVLLILFRAEILWALISTFWSRSKRYGYYHEAVSLSRAFYPFNFFYWAAQNKGSTPLAGLLLSLLKVPFNNHNLRFYLIWVSLQNCLIIEEKWSNLSEKEKAW